MAEVRVVRCNPSAPDALYLLLVVNPEASFEEQTVGRLSLSAYEGDGCFYFVQTDGWIEREIEEQKLKVEVYVYLAAAQRLGVDLTRFQKRSTVDRDAVCLLSVVSEIEVEAMNMVGEETLVATGENFDATLAALVSGDEAPVIFAPSP